MQSSKDIKLKSYDIDGLLIRQMSYIKKINMYVQKSPKRNTACSFNRNRREAAKKIARNMKKNYTRDSTKKIFF